MVQWVSQFGWLGSEHVRKNHRSLVGTHRVRGEALDAVALHTLDREYTLSTQGVLVVVPHMCSSTKLKDVTSQTSSKGHDFLSSFLAELLRGVDAQLMLEVSDKEWLECRLTDCFLELQSGSTRALSAMRVLAFETHQRLAIAAFIQALYNARNDGKPHSLKRAIFRRTFWCLVDGVAQEVEASKGDKIWEEVDHVVLPVLRQTHVGGKSCTRRMPYTTAVKVVQALEEEQSVRTPEQLLAAERIMNRRRRLGKNAKGLLGKSELKTKSRRATFRRDAHAAVRADLPSRVRKIAALVVRFGWLASCEQRGAVDSARLPVLAPTLLGLSHGT